MDFLSVKDNFEHCDWLTMFMKVTWPETGLSLVTVKLFSEPLLRPAWHHVFQFCSVMYSTSLQLRVRVRLMVQRVVTQRNFTHVILCNQIAQMEIRRKNTKIKKLVKMMRKMNMTKLVIIRLMSLLRSWEN